MLRWLRERVDLLSGGGLGRRGERQACRFLRRRGMRVVARNVRAGRGEIDVVALDGSSLVFVEVKSRTVETRERDPARDRSGLDKLDERKCRALRRSCRRYVRRLAPAFESCRIDVVTVEFERGGRVREIRWYPGYVEM